MEENKRIFVLGTYKKGMEEFDKTLKKKILFDKTYFESMSLKALHEKYKDFLTEEQNKELEELIRMEENKYYQPSIEEFYIGFEFEHLNYSGKLMANHLNNKVEWNKEICDSDWLNIICSDYEEDLEEVKRYRVKYLDKEDIESLGFKFVKINPNFGELVFIKQVVGNIVGDNIFYQLTWLQGKLWIDTEEHTSYGRHENRLFQGSIKNKSELKRLLKQLSING